MDIYIETLGCPKNVNDSEIAAGILERAGHRVTGSIEEADAVIVNTCCFIEDAKRESLASIFDAAAAKKKGALLIVTGCLPERYRDRLFKQLHEADIVIGVNDYDDLPSLIENHVEKRQMRFSEAENVYREAPIRRLPDAPYSATLKIAEGCDNRCTYCVIPSVRGRYRSRKAEDIESEAASLAALGCHELIIVAQDVTAYGIDLYGGYELPGLLHRLCGVEGIRWIRLMYCYEDRITDELIETIRREEKICNYIDIPVQHCSDKILKAMNRRSTKESIRGSVERLRKRIPDIHIRSTVITGFPGEGSGEFRELLEFVEDMKFERLGVFAYSKEEGTPAAKMKPQVLGKVKESRKNSIMLRQLEISRNINAQKVGGVFEVMVEGVDGTGAYFGRTRYDAPEIDNAVIFSSKKMLEAGDLVNVEITDAFDYDLTGREV